VSLATDIFLNKPVTNDVPYWLLLEHYLGHMPFETLHNIEMDVEKMSGVDWIDLA
jgi:hypothetical protein